MEPAAYRSFTDTLVERVRGEPSVLGLVALGSMARDPDVYSDHDFFLITKPNEQERYRSDLSWLPSAGRIVFSVEETEHGLKAVYDDGHIAEFAVFDPEELRVAKVNRYRVLFDREDIASRMERLARGEAMSDERAVASDAYLFGMFAANIITGVNRYARGERVSGDRFVKTHALDHLLAIIERSIEPTDADLRDDLDPTRRFEERYPQLADDVARALGLHAPEAAAVLLDLAERTRSSVHFDVARRVLDRYDT